MATITKTFKLEIKMDSEVSEARWINFEDYKTKE